VPHNRSCPHVLAAGAVPEGRARAHSAGRARSGERKSRLHQSCQERPYARAIVRMRSVSSPKSTPAAAAAIGTRLTSVMPGTVLTSRH